MNPFLARFQNRPALVSEASSAALAASLVGLSGLVSTLGENAQEWLKPQASEDDDFWPEPDSYMAYVRPYTVKDGILQIPVKGSLLYDFPYQVFDLATGYEYIGQAIKRGLADDAVKGIALVVNSPGGMVSGCFDLSDRIHAARSVKPVTAFCEHAYSAAYALASAAGRLTVTRSGGVGSIGVVVVQAEMSRALDENGVTVNIIRSKPRKFEGNPYEVLSDEARASIQAEVNEIHQDFVALVARNRGMDAEAVDATDARCFMPREAVQNGLADEIGPFEDQMAAFAARFTQNEEITMAGTPEAAIPEEVLTKAVADARAEGLAEGARQQQQRISAILDSEEAEKRPAAARMLAFDTDMTVDAARKALGKLPEEKAAEAAAPAAPGGVGAALFAAAMDGTENPAVGAGKPTAEADTPEAKVEADRKLRAAVGLEL